MREILITALVQTLLTLLDGPTFKRILLPLCAKIREELDLDALEV